MQTAGSIVIDFVHPFGHFRVGADCLLLGLMCFVSKERISEIEDAQATFVGTSKTDRTGSSRRFSAHLAVKKKIPTVEVSALPKRNKMHR